MTILEKNHKKLTKVIICSNYVVLCHYTEYSHWNLNRNRQIEGIYSMINTWILSITENIFVVSGILFIQAYN